MLLFKKTYKRDHGRLSMSIFAAQNVIDQCFALEDTCTPSIVQTTTWSFGDASAEPAGEGWRAYVLPEYCRLLTFYHKRALNRQTEGSGLAQSAACLSGRQSYFNKLQYAYDSHKMINFKKMHSYPLFP